MAAAGVRFGAIDVARFIHALEAGDAVLLVKLRTLRQVSDAVKIFQFKQIRAAFRAGGDDLRRDDFR
jgi:hypothetical protein